MAACKGLPAWWCPVVACINGFLVSDPCGNVPRPSVETTRAEDKDAYLVHLSGDSNNHFTVRVNTSFYFLRYFPTYPT